MSEYFSSALLNFLIICLVGCSASHAPDFEDTDQKQVFEFMTKVFNYEIENFSNYQNSNTWINSTFFIGTMAAYNKTGYEPFLKESYHWSKSNNWKVGNRKYHADDQAAAQVYIELYKVFGQDFMISDFLNVVESMSAEEDEELRWWWIDALFMAPPGITDLALIKEKELFHNYTKSEWDKTYRELYNQEDSLFYRDKILDNHKTEAGGNVYWLRGNGWVIAGLAKMLNKLQPENTYYEDYKSVYLQLIEKLVTLQSEDGLWRSSLLRPAMYPIPDTSGSAFICYAIAWGVNNNILQDPQYKYAMLQSWNALTEKVNSAGKLQSVQPVGHQPVIFSSENGEMFGSGAFLLAASEIFTYHAEN